jgi:hypothetical protein
MVSRPVSGPFVWAVTVAVMEQEIPGASVGGQPFSCEKAPLAAMDAMASTALPVLVSFTDCDAIWPRVTFPTLRLVVEKVMAGACSRTETVFEAEAAAAKSRLPSPLKSPRTTATGPEATL